jgi:hypothetical protein
MENEQPEVEAVLGTQNGVELLTDLAVALVIGRPLDHSLSKIQQQEKLHDALDLLTFYLPSHDFKQAMRLVVDGLHQVQYSFMVPELAKAIIHKVGTDLFIYFQFIFWLFLPLWVLVRYLGDLVDYI